MFDLIESKREKIACQREFNRLLSRVWRKTENRRVVWRPDYEDLDVTHNDELWFVSVMPYAQQTTKRYWNSFGIYEPTGNLNITVEINIPTESNGRSVSGFYARDPMTNLTYLMHDGGIGGGRRGIGRESFLAWSGVELIPCVSKDGELRSGIPVAPLRSGKVGEGVSAFVHRVSAFKEAVSAGLVPTGASADKIRQNYNDYWKEFSGKKRRSRIKEVEYITRHGDVVDELTRWRPPEQKSGERLVKDGLIDLGIECRGNLRVLYEVKSSASRQSLYTAIGQLLVHARQSSQVERYVVVPEGEAIPKDILNTLAELSVDVLRYTINGERIVIREE